MKAKKPTMRKCNHGVPKFMCDICKPAPCSAIVWLADRYEAPDAEIYPHPLGSGWCCSLAIASAGIKREATAATKAEAARMVAEAVAHELGWPNTQRSEPPPQDHE